MLAAAGRPADEVIGPIPPRMWVVTLEKLAVNAVMAGCRPEYFPVVLAALEAALDDNIRLYGIQTATNTGSPLIIVNGPIVNKLALQCARQRVRPGQSRQCDGGPCAAIDTAQRWRRHARRNRHGDPRSFG